MYPKPITDLITPSLENILSQISKNYQVKK
jgi:hypothetical protein